MDVVAWDDRLKVVRPSILLHKLHMHTFIDVTLSATTADWGKCQQWVFTEFHTNVHSNHSNKNYYR